MVIQWMDMLASTKTNQRRYGFTNKKLKSKFFNNYTLAVLAKTDASTE